ncbi:MAG: response regulator transcription factor [Terracidiphilus sp.]
MRILLVDDSKRFLSGLKNMLESHDYDVVGVATSADEAMRQTHALAPDLLLMDIQMPGQSGIAATRAIKQAHPLLKIVMMTVSDSDEHLFEAIAAGADGYLLKGAPERFVDALAAFGRGEAPFTPGLAQKIMAEFARRARVPEGAANSAPTAKSKPGEALSAYEEKLTERQQWILSLIAGGCSYQEIARQVGISVAGVNYHVAEITARLHVENRAQAIACYLAQK